MIYYLTAAPLLAPVIITNTAHTVIPFIPLGLVATIIGIAVIGITAIVLYLTLKDKI